MEEPNENFRTEKYNNQNEKLSKVLNNRRKEPERLWGHSRARKEVSWKKWHFRPGS